MTADRLPLLLAIETSTPAMSVALMEGARLLGTMELRMDKAHARMLIPLADSLLRHTDRHRTDLAGVAVSAGPGSYTGLRVGVSAAKGLCMALGIPLIGISSLAGVAAQVHTLARRLDAWICPMTDARRMEVYCTILDCDGQEILPVCAQVVAEDTFLPWLAQRQILFVGDGVAKCVSLLEAHQGAICLPEVVPAATGIGYLGAGRLRQGQYSDLTTFEPEYLKSFATTQPRDLLRPAP
ncbi:MAG: tRNA (adenosine(37)-N6)-threonylcarbamoyltransferase complex dimerization subunit type 1 TsaB [Bacteroidia bacterium]|nr:tRNA (adenosine(37)-N6)-threonylcarbamoyltransferase complex dimerization subunit type 1 TsaB [Bacteroidia bacterium]